MDAKLNSSEGDDKGAAVVVSGALCEKRGMMMKRELHQLHLGIIYV